MKAWILVGGAIFFGFFTMALAKTAVDGAGGWVGLGSVACGLATFIMIFAAVDEAPGN